MGYMGVAIREGEDGRDGSETDQVGSFRILGEETDNDRDRLDGWTAGAGKTRWRSGGWEREMVGRI